jgi:hypothetical protein
VQDRLQLDAWLHRRLGGPYAVALSVGLLVDIAHRIHDAPQHVESKHRLIGVVPALFMEIGLLIHQLGEVRTGRTNSRPAAILG